MDNRNRIVLPRPMKQSLRVLQWELPMIMLWAVALLVVLLRDYAADPLGATHTFVDCMEYVGASLVLSFFTAILTDLILREGQSGAM